MNREFEWARDGQLVQRGQRGDVRALEQLVDLYHRPLFNVAFRLLGNSEDAADVTQTVFLKVFEGLDSYKPEYKFFSWVYRIAVNEALHFRKRGRGSEHLDESLQDQGHGPELASRHNELQGQIQSALALLSEEQKAVVVLRHFSECSYSEIAHILDIPEKTVRSRLFSGRSRLKDLLPTSEV